MTWTIEYSATAMRGLRKIDKTAARRIAKRMNERVASDDPTRGCIPLTGNMGDLCGYRIGGYRVICDIRHTAHIILVADVGPRGDIFKRFGSRV